MLGGRLKAPWLVTVIASLSGWAAPYVPPQSGPTARVLYTTTATVKASRVLSFDSDKCDGVQIVAKLNGQDSQQITGAANSELINSFHGYWAEGLNTITCYVTVRFLPVEGAQYRLDFDYVNRKCSALVLRDAGGNRYVQE